MQNKDLEKLTKQVAKGGGISFFGLLFGRAIGFIFQILLTRILGASVYGLYALGFSIISIISNISLMGLQNAVFRFGSIYRGEGDNAHLKGILYTALLISFGFAVVLSSLLFLFSNIIANCIFNETGLTIVIKIFSFALPFYTLMAITAYSARVFRCMEYDVGVRLIFHPLSNLLFVGISFLLGYRLLGVIYGFLFSSLLAAIMGLYLLYKIFPELISNLKPIYELKTILPYSLTVLLIGFSHILLLRIDRIMLGILGLVHEVGIYNAAAIMSIQASLFLVSVNAIFSPIIADLYNKGHINQLSNLFKTTTKWIFELTLPVFLVFVLFSRHIMGLFGEEFVVGWAVLVILGGAQLLNASVGSVGYTLTMTGRQKMELVNNLVLCGLNIFLNIILIRKFGILGAAIATGLSLGLINLLRLIEIYCLYKIHPYKLSYWKPVLAGTISVVSWLVVSNFLNFTGWLWITGVVIFMVIYLVILTLLGFEKEEKIVFKAVKKRLRRE